MAWSTSELARLATTTVNTVRHYHSRGLLDQPERDTNGYKRYGVEHLVRLLQIRRLREVGVPVAEISRIGTDLTAPAQLLRDIDARLEDSIEQSRRAQADIRAMLQHGSASGVPAGFERVASRLSGADRSLALIYSQLYDDAAMSDLLEMMETDSLSDSAAEFDDLSVDADEATRERLARHVATSMVDSLRRYPWLGAPQKHLLKDERTTADTWVESVLALYNPAQLDVLGKAGRLAVEEAAAIFPPSPETEKTVDFEPLVTISPEHSDPGSGRRPRAIATKPRSFSPDLP